METNNIQTITIDLKKPTMLQLPQFIQHDTNIIDFVILENGEAADLSNLGKITVNYKRPDKVEVPRLLVAEGNKVRYELGQEEMEVAGTGEIDLKFYSVDNLYRRSTKIFKVMMKKGLGLSYIESKQLTLLQELFVTVEELVVGTSGAKDYANEQGDYAKAQGDYVASKKTDIDKFTSEQNNLQAQINTLVVEGDSSPAAAQARVDAKGTTYATLKHRLDAKDAEFAAGLAENMALTNAISKTATTKNNGDWGARPLVTFIDDDGAVDVLTKLKPVFTAKGVPCVTALFNSSTVINNANYLQEMLDLQNNHGWEIASHTFGHISLLEKNEQEIREDSEAILKLLRGKGFIVESIVYPYGGYTRDSTRVIKEYYRSGVEVTTAEVNTNKFGERDVYKLVRISFGADTSKTFEHYKAFVDEAIANNSWAIFMTHCADSAFDSAQLNILSQLIDYIKSLSVKIVNLRDGLNYYEPLILAGENYNLEDYFQLYKDGKVFSNHAIDYKPINAHPSTDNRTKYKNPITVFNINSSGNSGFPGSGIVMTFKGHSVGFDFQIFFDYDTNNMAVRKTQSDGTWGSWKLQSHYVLSVNGKTETDKMNTYVNGTTMLGVTGWSIGNGVVTTHRIGMNQYDKQEFRVAASNSVYSRTTDASGNWLAWQKISTV